MKLGLDGPITRDAREWFEREFGGPLGTFKSTGGWHWFPGGVSALLREFAPDDFLFYFQYSNVAHGFTEGQVLLGNMALAGIAPKQAKALHVLHTAKFLIRTGSVGEVFWAPLHTPDSERFWSEATQLLVEWNRELGA